MDTIAMLDELQKKALHKESLRRKFLAARKEENPLEAFCRVAREEDYPLYPMEVIAAGEEFYASMRRSTNGGGENSPLLEGGDDYYELFLAALE